MVRRFIFTQSGQIMALVECVTLCIVAGNGLINHFAMVGATAVKSLVAGMKFADFCYWHAGSALC